MKKTILSAFAFVAIAASITIYSCKKETQTQLQQPPSAASDFNVSVKNNLLVFKTTEDYRNVVDNSSPEQMVKFMSEVKAMTNFTSYDKQYFSKNPSVLVDSTLINSDFLKTILNKDAAVQIGNYIYKIDIANEKVFALNASHETEYNDLVNGNTSNSNVQSFSTGDNVLDLIEESGQKKAESTMLFCKEDGIGDKHEEKRLFENNQPTNIFAITNFDRYGVYFSLYAQIYDVPANSPYVFEFTGGIAAGAGHIYYHKRCSDTKDYEISTAGVFRTNIKQEYEAYHGATSLNKVYFYCRIKNTKTKLYTTPYLGFRMNY